ncbi:DUF1190 domain-containing protein [Vibrio xiamenensis]|nr:DUF1190 domain-containing protein [Vibrio xiamenensis]
MRRRGTVNLARHMIGDKMPIVAFIGIGVTTLSGCNEHYDYTAYTKLSTCADDYDEEYCQYQFERAKETSISTAMKYKMERDCQQDYGDLCYQQYGLWIPKFTGILTKSAHWEENAIAHYKGKSLINQFAKDRPATPLFTSSNSKSSHYGYLFTAKGKIIDRYKGSDGKGYYAYGSLASFKKEDLNIYQSYLPVSDFYTTNPMGIRYQYFYYIPTTEPLTREEQHKAFNQGYYVSVEHADRKLMEQINKPYNKKWGLEFGHLTPTSATARTTSANPSRFEGGSSNSQPQGSFLGNADSSLSPSSFPKSRLNDSQVKIFKTYKEPLKTKNHPSN